jgi:hypothetical protein
MNLSRLAAVFAVGLLAPAVALAGTVCPTVAGSGITGTTGCDTLLTVNPNGSLSITFPSLAPYDGSDDNLVGIINNSSTPVSAVTLSGGSNPIFAFEGDGIDTFVPGSNASDTTTYGGPDAFFTGINSAETAGTVDFVTAIAGSGWQYRRIGWRCDSRTKQPDSSGYRHPWFGSKSPSPLRKVRRRIDWQTATLRDAARRFLRSASFFFGASPACEAVALVFSGVMSARVR